MAQNIINTKIKEAYDTEANWSKYNPVLLPGQLAFSSDKYGKYKVGNGSAKWSQLQYATLSWGDIAGKPSTFNPESHTHTWNQITNLAQASVNYAISAGTANSVAWNNVSGKPTSLKNPYALTISNYDNSQAIQYDGSSAKTLKITPDLLYGASDGAIASVIEKTSTGTRYVKLLDITSASTYHRTRQQFLISSRDYSFFLDINVASTDSSKFSVYKVSYIPLSENPIPISSFLTGIVNVDSTHNRFEFWYEQAQWGSSVSVIPLGRIYELREGHNILKGYHTTDPSGGTTTKPIFAITITLKNMIPVLYAGSDSAGGAATSAKGIIDNGDKRQLTFAYSKPDSTDFGYFAVWNGNELRSTDATNMKNKLGLNKVDNTADSEKSVKYATNAGSAGSVPWSGVSGKPSTFPPSSHTHTASQVTGLPTSLKNPNPLTLQLNGSSQGAYDGSAAKTVNITPGSIGAAPTSHTHSDYATTTNLNLAVNKLDAHEKELGVHKNLIDGKASSSHSHNSLKDFADNKDIGISSSTHVTPQEAVDYDIVITNTNPYNNKLVTMNKMNIAEQIIKHIPLAPITNTQIDSLKDL